MKSASKNQVINNILARTNFHKMTERSNEERLRILQERLAQINQKGDPSNQSISAEEAIKSTKKVAKGERLKARLSDGLMDIEVLNND